MNFALLGDSLSVRPMLLALRDGSRHRLTHAACVSEILDELLLDFPELRISENWSAFFEIENVDLVIVAGSSPEVLDGARKLAGSGQALAIVPEVTQGLELVYELSLIQDDTQTTFVPWIPLRTHPQVTRFRNALVRGELGPLLHIEFERLCSSDQLLFQSVDRDRVLLHDVDLLRCLAGNYSQITATESRLADAGISRATVAFAGSGCPAAAWTLRSGVEQDQWSIEVFGERGTARLECDAGSGELRLSSDTVAFPVVDGEAQSHWLRATHDLLDGIANPLEQSAQFPTWDDLTKAFETTDAVRRSLRRRRTIDLHFEQTSERALFKTQMAALGCGVLVFTLFGLIAYLIAASLFELPVPVLQALRALWMMPLFVYLLLQILLLIARPPSRPTDPEDADAEDADTEDADAEDADAEDAAPMDSM